MRLLKRYRINIAYDGTEYAGWQIQPNGMTIQERLETALKNLTGEDSRIHGSGRTDQGVHARKQTAHFDLEDGIAADSLQKGFNALLPSDIRVLNLWRVNRDFHARHSVKGKEYRYFIWNSEILPPFYVKYRTHIRKKLDAGKMRQVCGFLCGCRDFAAFSANPSRNVETTVRNLTHLAVKKHGSEIVIKACGDGFLYKMVRSIAGFMIRVGEGAVPP